MPTMVDAWGVSAHCDVCSAEADENDLEDDSAGRMACGHCTGSVFVFEPGTLHLKKDGSATLVIAEEDFELEDDRGEGPDGPEGSIHWRARLEPSEVIALRDFLNGFPTEPAKEPLVSQETPDLGHNEVCGTSANDKEAME